MQRRFSSALSAFPPLAPSDLLRQVDDPSLVELDDVQALRELSSQKVQLLQQVCVRGLVLVKTGLKGRDDGNEMLRGGDRTGGDDVHLLLLLLLIRGSSLGDKDGQGHLVRWAQVNEPASDRV